jgi:hypothetical protein
MYICDISLSSSENEKRFKQNCKGNQNTLFMFNNVFPKIMPLVRQCGKIL